MAMGSRGHDAAAHNGSDVRVIGIVENIHDALDCMAKTDNVLQLRFEWCGQVPYRHTIAFVCAHRR